MRYPLLSTRLATACVAFAISPPPLSAQDAPLFTIEQVLSVPFPSALAASSQGGVAWAFDSVGARNVWVALPPAYAARRLTPYATDDGQAITSVQWSPDGRTIVYIRGGDPNGHEEIPNPSLIPEGVHEEVWIVPATGGAPRRLGEGTGPSVAPGSGPGAGHVAFVQKGEIWWAPTGGVAKAEQLTHIRGKARSLRWSPDGTKLAFVSARGDHAFVGVYDVATRELRYLAPSVDNDDDPTWSPDGMRVAFVRQPAVTRAAVFGARRTGQPWSIWVAEAATGEGQAIWTAPAGPGSVFDGFDDFDDVGIDDILWGKGDVLIVPWERDGWLHLYRIPVRGGDATLLTPGAFEVMQATLTPDRGAILFASNQGDDQRRHIWRLPVDGDASAATAVTSGDGIEWAPMPLAPDGGTIAVLRSDARTPARPALVHAPGGASPRDLTVRPATFPASALVNPEPVTFTAADGMALHGQLFHPPHPRPGERLPAIVFFHGGSRRQMLLGFHYMSYYNNAYAMNQYLASLGYLVLSVNYRSGIGYGMPFREALAYGATGASEFNDVQGAGLYLRTRSDVDPARIGLWGGSYGGYLTALGLARASDLFAAGVDLHGVHDWNLEFDALIPGWDTAKDLLARHVAFRSSPLADVATWRSPVLLIQGDDDRNVQFSQTVQLTEDLRAHGVHVETLVFPDEVHDFLLHAHWVAVYKAAADFFARMLVSHAP